MKQTSYIRFIDLAEAFADRPVIAASEMLLRFPDLHRNSLALWVRKGQLQKVRTGYYRIARRPLNDHERWSIANAIWSPSYVSLRSAFGFYGFIPEGVFHVESVTSRITRRYQFIGTWYSYRRIRPSFFFGYRFIEQNGVRVMMATPEKALLDLLYLHSDLNDVDDFEAWRFDQSGILDAINEQRIKDYLTVAGSPALTRRYERFNRWLHDIP